MRKLKLFSLFLCLAIGIGQMWATDVSFSASSDSGNGSITKDGITVSMSTMNRDQKDNFRCNANTDMTVTSTVGNITQIVVTCTANGTANYGPGKFSGNGYNASTGKTGTWAGSSTSVKLHANAQVRITDIVVSYEGGSSKPTV